MDKYNPNTIKIGLKTVFCYNTPEIIEQIENNFSDDEKKIKYWLIDNVTEIVTYVANTGNYDILKKYNYWLKNLAIENNIMNIKKGWEYCINTGSIKLCRLYKNICDQKGFPIKIGKIMKYNCLTKVNEFMLTCERGNLKLAKFLLDNFQIDLASVEYGFRKSCQRGFWYLAKFLLKYSKNKYPININANNDFAFVQACAFNHLKIAKNLWNYSISNKNHDIRYLKYQRRDEKKRVGAVSEYIINVNAINGAFALGNIDMIEWLKSIGAKIDGIDIRYFFSKHCVKGNIKMIKYMFENYDEYINLNKDNCYILAHTLFFGHGNLDIANYLMRVTNNSILKNMKNISYVFSSCCFNNCLEEAKWLYQKCQELDIRVKYDFDCILKYGNLKKNVKMYVSNLAKKIVPEQ